MATHTDIICQNCDTAFAYTDAEREFRESRGLERPLICPACRARERGTRNGDLIALYERADSFEPFLVSGETRDDSQGRPGNGRGGRPQYTATCAACGNETRVPFVPRGDRPVYCRSCFNARRGR
jgi:CxxC-x17-CxxC domain-containing protein